MTMETKKYIAPLPWRVDRDQDRKQATLDVRNALFEVANGKPFGSVMQAIVMAQAKLAAVTCRGDPEATKAQLAYYHALMMDAVPIYCAEIQAGQSEPH